MSTVFELQTKEAIKRSLHEEWRNLPENAWIRRNDCVGDWHDVVPEDYGNGHMNPPKPALKTGGQSFYRENHEGKHDDD